MARRYLLGLTAVFICLGCNVDHFVLQEDKAGGTIRLNKSSGEMALLDGGRLLPIKEAIANPEDSALRRPRLWPRDSVGSKSEVTLRTRWSDGKLYYQALLRPVTDEIKSAMLLRQPRLTLYFLDSDGFNVAEIPIPLSQMSRTGDPVQSFVANTSTDMEAAAYRSAKTFVVSWAGF